MSLQDGVSMRRLALCLVLVLGLVAPSLDGWQQPTPPVGAAVTAAPQAPAGRGGGPGGGPGWRPGQIGRCRRGWSGDLQASCARGQGSRRQPWHEQDLTDGERRPGCLERHVEVRAGHLHILTRRRRYDDERSEQPPGADKLQQLPVPVRRSWDRSVVARRERAERRDYASSFSFGDC